MKYSVFAILLVLGGCATSGPPAVFEIDYHAAQGQASVSRTSTVPVPFNQTAQVAPAPIASSKVPAKTEPQLVLAPAAFKSNAMTQAALTAPTVAPSVSKVISQEAAPAAARSVKAVLASVVVSPPPAASSLSEATPTNAKPAPNLTPAASLKQLQTAAAAPAQTPVVVAQPIASKAAEHVVNVPHDGLRSALRAWSANAGWTLVWAPGVEDVQFAQPQRLDGSLALAVQTVSKLVPADSKLQITMYEGDKVIHVHPR